MLSKPQVDSGSCMGQDQQGAYVTFDEALLGSVSPGPALYVAVLWPACWSFADVIVCSGLGKSLVHGLGSESECCALTSDCWSVSQPLLQP